jgi:hypothetical protein
LDKGLDPRNYFEYNTWMRCSKCSENCGDDLKTETKYREEKNFGNRTKVILLQIYDMVDIDNLQKSEIKALLNNLIDEHIEETDELQKPINKDKRKGK